ncbi:MAG: periplasmic heavy metal sensor [Thermodesulfobacteriota bacterium]
MNKNIRIFVVCSVVLNIFLIGFVIGKYTHRRGVKDVGSVVKALPPTKQEIARRLFPGARSEEGLRVSELNNIRRGIIDELNAEEFDAEEYQKKLDALERVRAKLREHYTLAVKEMARNFTVEERRMLVKALVKRRPSRAGKTPFSFSSDKEKK